MMEWCPCCRTDFLGMACGRYKAHGGWLQGLTPFDSRELSSCVMFLKSTSLNSCFFVKFACGCRYAHGTCFRKMLLGHSSALSVAYYHPSRATVAREFRDSFLQNLGLAAVLKGRGWGGGSDLVWRQRVPSLPPPPLPPP